MTENEWIYIKETHALDVSYKQLMKFENRELAWRFAHIKSGMKLTRMEWELQQAAIIKAKLEAKRKRKANIMYWIYVFLFFAIPILLIYFQAPLSETFEFLFVGSNKR